MSAGYDRSVDPALDTLLLPFVNGALPWPTEPPGRVLFLRARAGHEWLHEHQASLVCEQSFKPDADELIRAGFNVSASLDSAASYEIALLLPPRQRDEARALIARALQLLSTGGVIVLAATNNEGARSCESDLRQLMNDVQSLSKNKSRVCWASKSSNTLPDLANEWLALDSPRQICDGRFLSRPGIFAWDRVDAASALLASHLPKSLSGHAADLGCGFGYLSVELLQRCPQLKSLDLYEAEARALEIAKLNVNDQLRTRAHGSTPSITFHWTDVTRGLARKDYDVIVTNPPFHTQSRTDRPDIGQRFITVAAESLNPNGQLWLVANRHLPYEALLGSSFASIETVGQEHGFKVIHAVKQRATRAR